MVTLTVAAAEMKKVARAIRRMDNNAGDLTTVWRRAGSQIARDNRRQFATKGAFQGTPWKPLAASTLRRKSRKTILRESGALHRSFTGRPMGIEVYGAKEAHYGSPLPTAVWQQFGTYMNGRRHIPPRPIQKLNAETRKVIVSMVVTHVMRGTGL